MVKPSFSSRALRVFQSLIGRLQITDGRGSVHPSGWFQSLIGRLQIHTPYLVRARNGKFQSLIGRLQMFVKVDDNWIVYYCFNPS